MHIAILALGARGDVQPYAESEEMRKLLEKGNFITITLRTAKAAERAALQSSKLKMALPIQLRA